MQYRVFWAPYAEERLEKFLQIAPEPNTLAAVAREIDRYLINGPETFGESRYDTIRLGFVFLSAYNLK
jgi:hypothetical protein